MVAATKARRTFPRSEPTLVLVRFRPFYCPKFTFWPVGDVNCGGVDGSVGDPCIILSWADCETTSGFAPEELFGGEIGGCDCPWPPISAPNVGDVAVAGGGTGVADMRGIENDISTYLASQRQRLCLVSGLREILS